MKKYMNLISLLIALSLTLGMTSCREKDKPEDPNNNTSNEEIIEEEPDEKDPEENDEEDSDESITEEYLYHVWINTNPEAPTGDRQYVVHEVDNLLEGEIDSKGTGVEVPNEGFSSSVILKDGFYYTITNNKDFVKYDGRFQEVDKFPLPTIRGRLFTHAWIGENMLLMISRDTAKDTPERMYWAKVDVNSMKLVDSGTLDFTEALESIGEKGADGETERYNTSGMLAYRKADNKVIYTFEITPIANMGVSVRKRFYLAILNPEDLSIEHISVEDRAEFMSSAAYGELKQHKAFFDEKGDYYISCNSVNIDPAENPKPSSTVQHRGRVLRIKAGEMEFDKSWEGREGMERGKLITMDYLGNGEVLLLIQDPKHCTPDNPVWDRKTNPNVFYWVTLDLKTNEETELDVPYSTGNLSQLAIVQSDAVYIAVNTTEKAGQIYRYDRKSGEVVAGTMITEGQIIDRLDLYNTKKK